jgi:hypothetical protein
MCLDYGEYICNRNEEYQDDKLAWCEMIPISYVDLLRNYLPLPYHRSGNSWGIYSRWDLEISRYFSQDSLPGSTSLKFPVFFIKKFIQKYLEILKNDTQLIICTS